MTKIQPAMFNLQASEKEMAQLIPQLLQTALFCQANPTAGREGSVSIMGADDDEENDTCPCNLDEALANGNIQLAIPVDTAIYSLLRSHCAKGARQAEEVINTAMMSNYTPLQVGAHSFSAMPPIIKFHQTPPNLLASSRFLPYHQTSSNASSNENLQVCRQKGHSNVSSSSLSERSTTASSKLSTTTSASSLLTSDASRKDSEETNHSFSCSSGSTLHGDMGTVAEGPTSPQHGKKEVGGSTCNTIDEDERIHRLKKKKPVGRTLSNKQRKQSTVLQPLRTRADSTGSDISLNEPSTPRYVPENCWSTSIVDNNTITAQYGNTSGYPTIWWEPSFKVDFRLSTSVGSLSGTVTGIHPSNPEVTLKVFNNSAKQIGFSIRSYRQSTVFTSHVVYPKRGLQVLEPYKSWEDNVEFYPNNPNVTEMFVVDLFFCTVDTKPVWNVIRRYAIMKAQKKYVCVCVFGILVVCSLVWCVSLVEECKE